MDRFPSPVIVWILTSFNNFCLVLNSSINFVVYCLVGRSFRNTLVKIFDVRSSIRRRRNKKNDSRGRSMMANSPGGGGVHNEMLADLYYTEACRSVDPETPGILNNEESHFFTAPKQPLHVDPTVKRAIKHFDLDDDHRDHL